MKLLVTTGPGLWHEPYGHIVVVDWPTGRVIDSLRWRLTVHDKSHKGIAGAWRDGRMLYAVTESEVLCVELAPLRPVRVTTYRWANDLHHVCAASGRLWVCNSGLECVDELDLDSLRIVRTWNLLEWAGRRFRAFYRVTVTAARRAWRRRTGGEDFYPHLTRNGSFPYYKKMLYPRRFLRIAQRVGDYRKADLRPHVLHPNHCFPYKGDIFVTVFGTGEVLTLKSGTILARGLGRPHDGLVVGDTLYVTDCASNVIRSVKLGPAAKCQEVVAVTSELVEGFLRELYVSDNRLWAGLTARRGAPEHLRRARIVELDRRTGQRVRQWELPVKYGTSVFSILDVSDLY